MCRMQKLLGYIGIDKGCNSGAFSCIDNLASLVTNCPSPVWVFETIAPRQLPVWVLKNWIKRIITVTIWHIKDMISNVVNDNDAIVSEKFQTVQFMWNGCNCSHTNCIYFWGGGEEFPSPLTPSPTRNAVLVLPTSVNLFQVPTSGGGSSSPPSTPPSTWKCQPCKAFVLILQHYLVPFHELCAYICWNCVSMEIQNAVPWKYKMCFHEKWN